MPQRPDVRPVAAAAIRVATALAAVAIAGCAAPPNRDAEEAAANTVACALGNERVVIRFDAGEVRVLLPGGDRVTLYQVPTASGVRYTNGLVELRSSNNDLHLVRDGLAAPLTGCAPYAAPAK